MTATLDPERLEQFIGELDDAGFVDTGDRTTFVGPLPPSLAEFTDATEMTLVIREPWPYRQPTVHVTGIDWWHSAHDAPCLWQGDDNTKRWVTLAGVLDRIDEWAAKAKTRFADIDGAALDPHLYFEAHPIGWVGLDIDGLIGNLQQDGQHGKLHVHTPTSGFPEIRSGSKPGAAFEGRWFYRDKITSPPKNGDAFEAALTDKQRNNLTGLLAGLGQAVIVLAWPTPHGIASLPLIITQQPGGRIYQTAQPTPISMTDRRRRAGPDADTVADKRAALFGLGAIGSNVASLLSRSGLGNLVAIDGDMKTPVGLVRHAFPGVGIVKAAEVPAALSAFEWTTVEPLAVCPWGIDTLRHLIQGADLCIDATGNSLFSELLARVALDASIPFVGVALFRGGRLLRVRRQVDGDTPITARSRRWRYPTIPDATDPEADFLGAETGCAAAIHNAPPASVTAAASIATHVAIDLLTGRWDYPDEIIDVLAPLEPPFDRLGRHQPAAPPVLLTDSARVTMISAARVTHPAETGGILIGARDDTGGCCVVEAIEFRPAAPSPSRYQVPEGVTQPAVEAAHETDDRLEYLGEWHSHPSDQPASPTDIATMLDLAIQHDSRDPVLFVLRPVTPETIEIDAYLTTADGLASVEVVEVGSLPPKDTP